MGVVPEPGTPRRLPRRVLVLVLLLLGAQVVLLVALVPSVRSPQLHRAPVTVVAPAAAQEGFSDRLAEVPGDSFDVTLTTDGAQARRDLRRGRTLAVIAVDLGGTEDVLLVDGRADRRLRAAVVAQLSEVSRAYGRTLEVSATKATGPSRPRAVWALFLLAGFGIAVVVSLLFGSVAASPLRGATRLLLATGLLTAGAAAAAVLALPDGSSTGERLALAGTLVLVGLVSATITFALEAVTGLGGLALAAGIFLVLAGPQLVSPSPYLLPDPWPFASTVTPSGAGAGLVDPSAAHGVQSPARDVATLAAWLGAGLLTLAVSRRARRERRARPDSGLDRPWTWRDAAPSGSWRLRVLAVVGPVTLLAVLATLLVPSGTRTETEELRDLATRTRCERAGPATSVADLNRLVETIRGQGALQGGDVGADTVLGDGRRLIMFGDTLRTDGGGQRFVRNAMLLAGEDCLQVVLPAGSGPVIPDRPRRPGEPKEPVGYWPMSVVAEPFPEYDLVTVFAQRVRSTGVGGEDFENLGPAFARLFVPTGGTPQLLEVRDVGPDSADTTRPTWGAASAVRGGRLYLYGTARPEDPGEDLVLGFSLRVARTRLEDAADPSTWRYWDGQRWQARPARAATLVPAAGGTSQTLSVFRQAGSWWALSKRDEFVGTQVTMWRAPHPWGPFDDGTAVARLPSDTAKGVLRYMPLAHPGLLPRRGTVVVSYSRNRTDVDEVLADPLRYRPRLLRVTLPDAAS
jgi:hypothetical protein